MPDTNANPNPNPGAWAESLDAEMKPWVSGMGLDKLDAAAALTKVLPMYRGAEQKLGVPADQVLRLPGKDAKPEEWQPIYRRLGAPEKAEEYGLTAPEGDSGEFLKTATGWFHKHNVPKAMAAGLAAEWNEFAAAEKARADGLWNQRFDEEMNALKGDWKGEDFNKNTDLAKRVMKTMGFSPEQLTALERALGPRAMLSAFAKFGSAVGEHRFVTGDGPKDFGMTPEGAKGRIADLQKDSKWMAEYLSGNADKKAEWTRLHEIAYGTGPANTAQVDVTA